MKLLLSLAAALFAWPCAYAQDYPSRPIRIVAPAAAGSGTDLTARSIGQQISAFLKQPVIVENKVGGGGTIGVEYVVRSAPDGYTLLLSTDATVAIQPHVSRVSYNTLTDLAPIGEVGNFPLIVLSRGDGAIKSLPDLARAARTNAKGLSYGMGGNGTGGHIVGETVRLGLGVPLTAVAYPSAARAISDLLAGHVDLAFGDTSAMSQIHAGKLTAVAVASAQRAACLPSVPTLAEQGVAFDLPYSYGLLAPAGTPRPVIDKLNAALVAALKSAPVREQQSQACVSPPPTDNGPDDFGKRVRYHHERWGSLIRNAGVKLP